MGPADPASYLTLERGTPVRSRDGQEVGLVDHVLADAEVDIFDGLVIDADGEWRFADATQVADVRADAVTLSVDADAVHSLPEPGANPAVLDAGPDDTVPDDLRDRLRRAWDYISGNY